MSLREPVVAKTLYQLKVGLGDLKAEIRNLFVHAYIENAETVWPKVTLFENGEFVLSAAESYPRLQKAISDFERDSGEIVTNVVVSILKPRTAFPMHKDSDERGFRYHLNLTGTPTSFGVHFRDGKYEVNSIPRDSYYYKFRGDCLHTYINSGAFYRLHLLLRTKAKG